MIKRIHLPATFSIILMLLSGLHTISMAANCDSINAPLTSKFRFLGSWDANGKPNYLEPENDLVSSNLIKFVTTALPETVSVAENDEYFNDEVRFNTELNEASEVFLTMVHEGAGWKNTLGYYTYDINNPPSTVYDLDSMVVLFPNVSQPGTVNPGEKILLGSFPAGTGIGYFLIAKGWNEGSICIDSHIVFTDPKLNTYTTPEFRQQTILLNYEQDEKLLLCFEDNKRPAGDDDFNDAVFYITANPGAIDTTDIPKIPTAKISGDTSICDVNAPAKLKVALTGKAPWSFVITNGTETAKYEDVQVNDYVLETVLKGTITLTSVKDKNKNGIVSGEATVLNHLPTAQIEEFINGCTINDPVAKVSLTGQGPWTVAYSINGKSYSANSSADMLDIPITEEGEFALLSVTDALCSGSAEGSIEVALIPSPRAMISTEGVLCNDGVATVKVSLSGVAPFSFVYTDGSTETTVTTSESSYEFAVSETGTYSLVRVDDANCGGEVNGLAVVSDGTEDINVEIDAPASTCFGEDIALALLGETDGLAVKWTTEGQGVINNADQLNASYSPADNETGEVVFYAEVDNGCAVKTVSKKVVINEAIDASFEYSPADDILTNSTITFVPAMNSYDEYAWDFGDENTSSATLASTEYTQGGVYTVTLVVTQDGCSGEGNAELAVLSKDELYVPNAFNPTAQNPENQVVKVYGNNVDEDGFDFKIVNRWGKVMYQSNSFAEANSVGWNGVNNNNNVQQELNVYTYLLKGKFIEGEKFERTGTITQVK
ncbi:MAG: DUF4114 domain-containing protein [Cyclobacteriaceae bacterium]|nr:DUF4114 domain-containing protein [Cyclobacteriaceae bacterium]